MSIASTENASRPLQGQVALVTGGSRGIGAAICQQLSALGAQVIVNFSSQPEAAAAVVDGIVSAGGSAQALQFSVSDSAAVDAAFDTVKQRFGKLDILVNNAGIAKDGLLLRFKDEDWARTLEVNLSGSFYCARAAAKLMLKGRYGRVVNISSVVGEMGNAGQSAYVASKAGLIGLTKSMARELSSRQITVNAVTPGFIETDMTSGLSEELRNEHLKAIPLGRYGLSAEVAALVCFLASPQSGYITGQVIGINGGMYM
jgi:3-oxoacyl-[acyl-carrier protein] reductase